MDMRARLLVGLLLLPAAAGAQEFAVSLTDGTTRRGTPVAIEAKGGSWTLTLRTGTETQTLAAAQVLALHGKPPRPLEQSCVQLVGGDQFHGEVRGGDARGESLLVHSRSLGECAVPVDRLRTIVFSKYVRDVEPDELRVPEGSRAEEALFRKARRGFDTIIGSIHRFTRTGVLFEVEADKPREFAYESLLGLALVGGVPPKVRPSAQLITRSGDQIAVEILGLDHEQLRVRSEGEQVLLLPLAEVAALNCFAPSRRFLSDLTPEGVEERAFFAKAPVPLYGFRKDRSATGQFLAVGGLCYGKGLGVHSRARLSYRVPAGSTRFVAQVAFDDEALELRWHKPAVDVRVQLDGTTLIGFEALRAGDGIKALGAIPVKPGSLLTLEVDFGPDADFGDRVDWLTAVFLE